MNINRVGLIGLGEAGSIIAADLNERGIPVQVYDRLCETASGHHMMLERAGSYGARLCSSAADACADTDLVISAVTAGQALDVAHKVAPKLRADQFYLDINSVAPATKLAASTLVEGSGAHYVEAAVMAPIPPQRLATPMLLGGKRAQALASSLNSMGFNTRTVASSIGRASAIKMCRSVMIKGLEALTSECLAAAHFYGAENEVLESLENSFPGMGWNAELPGYLIGRIAEHGRRRAEEMEEVSQTVANANVMPHMSRAIVTSQRKLVDAMESSGLDYRQLQPFDWRLLFSNLQIVN